MPLTSKLVKCIEQNARSHRMMCGWRKEWVGKMYPDIILFNKIIVQGVPSAPATKAVLKEHSQDTHALTCSS